VSLDSLNIEAGRIKSWIKGYDEIVKEADLPKQIFGQVPREPSFYIDYVCSYYELHVMVVNF